MASASASVASTDEAFIPEDLLERLLDSFSEDSDFDDNLVAVDECIPFRGCLSFKQTDQVGYEGVDAGRLENRLQLLV